MIASTTMKVPKFDEKNVRHAVRYYKKMGYHRSVVLEGVRRSAMRNRHYWYETLEQLTSERARSPTNDEILDRINLRQDQTAESEFEIVARTSDAFRLEAGLETPEKGFPFSRAHELRRLLEPRLTSQILHCNWDIYLCLLYVELEGYQTHARSTPALRCPTIEAFLGGNRAFIDWLKSFRDKLLHPISELTSDDLAQEYVRTLNGSSSSELSHVVALQGMMDCHLVAVRQGVVRVRGLEWVSSHLGSASPDTNMMSGDQIIGLGNFASAPNLSILLCAGLASKMMESDSTPGPSPMDSLPESVRSGVSNMLLRSLILISERTGTVDFVKLFRSDNPDRLSSTEIAELSRDGSVPRTIQEYNNILALDRVAVALLHEPLRIYLELAGSSGTHGLNSISESIPQGKALSALRSFRNVVFHVRPGRTNPDLIESRWLEFIDTYTSMELLSTLLSFFGYSHFCPLDSVWAFPLRSSKASKIQDGSSEAVR